MKKNVQKQSDKVRSWIAPTMVSACVFGLLTAASLLGTGVSILLAALLVIVGLILLRFV